MPLNLFDITIVLFIVSVAILGFISGFVRSLQRVLFFSLSYVIATLLSARAAFATRPFFDVGSIVEFFNPRGHYDRKIIESLKDFVFFEPQAARLDAMFPTLPQMLGYTLLTMMVWFVLFLILISVFRLFAKRPKKMKRNQPPHSEQEPQPSVKKFRVAGFLMNLVLSVAFVILLFNGTLMSSFSPTGLLAKQQEDSIIVSWIQSQPLLVTENHRATLALINLLQDPNTDRITLTEDTNLTKTVRIDRPVMLTGGGRTLTGDLLVTSDDVVLTDLVTNGNIILDLSQSGRLTLNEVLVHGSMEVKGLHPGEVAMQGDSRLAGLMTVTNRDFSLHLEQQTGVSKLLVKSEGVSVQGQGHLFVVESLTADVNVSEHIQVTHTVQSIFREFFIRFIPGTTEQTKRDVWQSVDGAILDYFETIDVYHIHIGADHLTDAYHLLADDPNIEFLSANYIHEISLELIVTEEKFEQLWALRNEGQTVQGVRGTAGIDINVLEAWGVTRGDADVVVAVIDSGVCITHSDLAPNIWINPNETADGQDTAGNGFVDDIHGWNFLHDNASLCDGALDDHGTHCAGTIAAAADQAGIVGVAPNVTIMSLKFMDQRTGGQTADLIRAISYAQEQGVLITNNSYGMYGFDRALKEAIRSSGMLFVAAAGNDHSNNDLVPVYPANFDLPNVLSVAAIDSNGELASFSNYGRQTVHLGAPGVHILSTVSSGYAYMSGTSMAAPHVAGVAALIASNGENNPIRIRQMILDAAAKTPLTSLSETTVTGGMLNAALSLGIGEIPSATDEIDSDDRSLQTSPAPGDLHIGDYVRFGGYQNESILWRVMDKDEQSVWLIAENILTLKAFDANSDAPSGRDQNGQRVRFGSNYWFESNIRQWLNSDAKAVAYTTAAPINAHMAWHLDGYADEPGFLHGFSPIEKQSMLIMREPVILPQIDITSVGYDGGTAVMPHVEGAADEDVFEIGTIAANAEHAFYKRSEDLVLLPSVVDLYTRILPNELGITVQVTESAFEKSSVIQQRTAGAHIDQPRAYWVRTPVAPTAHRLYFVTDEGLLSVAPAYGAAPGIRPMIRISPDMLVKGLGSRSDPYRTTDHTDSFVDPDEPEKDEAPIEEPVPTEIGIEPLQQTPDAEVYKQRQNVRTGGFVLVDGNRMAMFTRDSPAGTNFEFWQLDVFTGETSMLFDVSLSEAPADDNFGLHIASLTQDEEYWMFSGLFSRFIVSVSKEDGSYTLITDFSNDTQPAHRDWGGVSNLYGKNGWIYYETPHFFGRVRHDGTDHTIFHHDTGSSDTEVFRGAIAYANDGIYYQVMHFEEEYTDIYRVPYDFSDSTTPQKVMRIDERIQFTVTNDTVYYMIESHLARSLQGLYSVRIADGLQKTIWDGDHFGHSPMLLVQEEVAYVIAKDQGLCTIPLDGTGALKLLVPLDETQVHTIYLTHNRIYQLTEDLYVMNPDGTSRHKIDVKDTELAQLWP